MTAVLPTAARRAPVPGLRHERRWWDEGAIVAGIDEVGRGALAGPVTYCAVVLPRDRRLYKLRDSKVLEPDLRRDMATRVRHFALGIGIGEASNDEIDRVGMTVAIQRAARRALAALPLRPDVVLIDGNWDFLRGNGTTNELLIRGDSRSASIAAASIVAKVTRDALMTEACPGYPAYGFSSNKGYAAPVHLRSLRTWGPSPLHRRTWAPVRGAEDPDLAVGDALDGPA
jgi:ribonuclease HII